MFTETLIATFILGLMAGMAYSFVVAVRPLERRIRDMNRDRLRDARKQLYRTEERRKHLGTPYIRADRGSGSIDFLTNEVLHGKPGLRLVNGEPLYSSQWLNDDASVS